MLKHSGQREAILGYLSTRKDHPTAEKVYEAVREEYPNISLGTVYRNLSLLSEIGEIQKVVCEDDSSDHFDFDTTPHQHFFCRNCGSVLDVPLENDASVMRMLEMAMNVRIEGQKTVYYGVCADCKKIGNF